MEELLTIDVRNNSAWNQRYYILQKYRLPTDAVLKEELEYGNILMCFFKKNLCQVRL